MESYRKIDYDEKIKIEQSSLLEPEKQLLKLLKLIKLNDDQMFQSIISGITEEDEKYIVNLLEKREGYDLTLELILDPICMKLLERIRTFVYRRDKKFYMFLQRQLT